MPIAMQTRPQSLHPSTLEVSRGLRDSKGYGVRMGLRTQGIRSLGKRFNIDPDNAASISFSSEPRLLAMQMNSMQMNPFARLPQEPEDARITGVTRSLPRRLLALNISGSLRAVRQAMRSEPIPRQEKIA